MKDGYFGDINDYKKYGLLRLLSGLGEVRTAICWALTPLAVSDHSHSSKHKDGKFTDYLEKPEKYRRHDPVLFDYLLDQVLVRQIRKVSCIEKSGILPNSCFSGNSYLPDDKNLREKYFDSFAGHIKGSGLLFFDPDNGLEVKSVPRGRKGSSKYIYLDEIEMFYKLGYSILLFQYFPRMNRDHYIADQVYKLKSKTSVNCIFTYCTSRVVFLLIPQAQNLNIFRKNSQLISEKWGKEIQFSEY